MKLYKWPFIWGLCVSTALLASCQSFQELSPNQMIENVLAAEKSMSYYAEMKMDVKGMDEFESSTVKEWRTQDKARVEFTMGDEFVISVLNGDTMKVFSESENKAFILQDDEMEGVAHNPKEQLELFLDMVKDTHDIETVGEEKFLGRPTYHLLAKKREDAKSLFGDQELWIDKENWIVLKMTSVSGEVQTNVEVTKIDFNPTIDASKFELELPEGVELEEMPDSPNNEEIALEDVPNKLGETVLHIPSDERATIETISYTEIDGEFSVKSVNMDYSSNGLPHVTLSISSSSDDPEMDEGREMLDEMAEQVEVRDESGYFFDLPDFRSLDWKEKGLDYSIQFIDPNVTLEEALELAEKMIEINE